MDVADMADKTSAPFRRMARRLQLIDLAPVPPIKTNADGAPICVRCDADITQRRRIIANAQRCADCQQDVENGNRHGKRS
jgi:RNA polymerase-binding transcription factor DksA